jgi:hypothetical protein
MWVSLFGGSQDSKKYRVKIICNDKNGNVAQTGKVFPIDARQDQITEWRKTKHSRFRGKKLVLYCKGAEK